MNDGERLGVLDGLRGVAVLLVLWYHVWEISWLPAPLPWLQFIPETGFIGVPLFFFLSGFVITYPFLRARIAQKTQPTWGHFAWRRFIKIVPSYLLSIALAYAIGFAATQGGGPAWRDVLAHLFFVHTWWPATYGSINGVLWTLAVEVEFYSIFPLVWWCFARRPWLTALGMIAVAFAWRSWAAACCYSTNFPLLEENLPGYLDLFACGMLAAYIFVRYRNFGENPLVRRYAPVVACLGGAALIALLLNLYHYRAADQWSSVWMIHKRALLGFAFLTIAIGALWSPREWQVLLANPPLRFLAVISYTLYLYHQIIARELLAWHIPPYSGDPHVNFGWAVPYTALAFGVATAQATLFTYFFERPLMRVRFPRQRRRVPV